MFLNIRYSKNKHLTIIYFVELSVHSAITLLPLYTMQTQKDCTLLGTRRSQVISVVFLRLVWLISCLEYSELLCTLGFLQSYKTRNRTHNDCTMIKVF